MTRVFGVLCVRDAADVVGAVLRNTLALGVERVIVLDNGSTDGTTQVLERLARRHPIDWSPYSGPFVQAQIISDLVAGAVAAGADWVLPVDADEFWWCERGLLNVLDQTDAGALYCPFVQFVQRWDVEHGTPRGLLTMTRRAAERPPDDDPPAVVARGDASVVEIRQPRKVIVRAGPGVGVGVGAHDAVNAPGPLAPADDIVVLHAPLRARATLTARTVRPMRADHTEVAADELTAWHAKRWRRLAAEGPDALDAEWRANAYGPNGTLLVGGREHATIEDHRLAEAAAPWVGRRWGRRRA